jgi:hypothetical protein
MRWKRAKRLIGKRVTRRSFGRKRSEVEAKKEENRREKWICFGQSR